MIRISKMADYGVAIMAELAKDGGRLSANELGDRIDLGVQSSAKILKMLAKAGLVASSRGKAGGYELSRAAESISMLHVVEAIDGSVGLTDCARACQEKAAPCGREASCLAKEAMRGLSAAICAMLGSVPISALDGESSIRFEASAKKSKIRGLSGEIAIIGEIRMPEQAKRDA